VTPATDDGAAATLTWDRFGLIAALTGGDLSGIEIDGDAGGPARLFALLDAPDPDFDIVVP